VLQCEYDSVNSKRLENRVFIPPLYILSQRTFDQFAVATLLRTMSPRKPRDGTSGVFLSSCDVVYYFGQDRYYYDQFYDPIEITTAATLPCRET